MVSEMYTEINSSLRVFKSLQYLKVKVMEPRRNNSTATSEAKIQTFILAVTETTETHVQAIDSIIKNKYGK